MPNVFVSYSRRDFYAAEALTSVLAASGRVTPWLDVEHLRPGTDWEVAINGAIDAADAVVVVGSPAAMASKWVTGEWQRALAARKPVHVALVRDTELPLELVSVHDLRGSFFKEARSLVDVIWGQVPPLRRRFPVSPQLALLWAVLLFCTVIAGVGATLGWDISEVYRPVHASMARIGLMLGLVNAVGVAGLSYLMVRLARRSLSTLLLRDGFIVATMASSFSLIGVLMTAQRSYRDLAGADGRQDSVWLYLAAVVLAVVGNQLVKRSRTVHLEMPTGAGEDHLRRRAKGVRARRRLWGAFGRRWAEYRPKFAALKEAMPGVGSSATYQVMYHLDDEPIGKLIEHGCDSAGFEADAVDPHWFFLVVTSRTPRELVRRVREVYGDRAVFVLATSMRMSEDDDELRRHQWLDFREQEPEGLYDFLRAVVTPSATERGVVTVPMGTDSFRAPLYVTGYVLFGRVVLGMTAGPTFGALIGGALTIPLALVTAAFGAAVLNLTRRTAARTIDQAGWLLRTVLVILLFIGWLVLAPNLPDVLFVPVVNRVAFCAFVALGLLAPTVFLLAHWLPSVREDVPRTVPPDPVTPTKFSPSDVLWPLMLAVGYFWAVNA